MEGLTNVLSWGKAWLDFDVRYLEAWGGRLGKEVKSGHWWLWLTSIYVHQNLQHIVANMLLFLVLASHLELTYGYWRLALVWLISGANPAACAQRRCGWWQGFQRCPRGAQAVRSSPHH